MNQPNKQNPPVYVYSGDEIIKLPYDKETQFSDADDSFEPAVAMVSVKCGNCGSVNVLIDDDVERTETHPREMGNESHYGAKCEAYCESCEQEMSVEVSFSEYADTWIFSSRDQENCEMVEVGGFGEALETFRKMAEDVRGQP